MNGSVTCHSIKIGLGHALSKIARKFKRLHWLLVWLLILAPQTTIAAVADDLVKGIGARAANIAALPLVPIVWGVALLVSVVAGIIIAIEGALIGWILDPNNFPIANLPAVQGGWGIVRDLANLFFILALIWIALATMLRLEGYGMRQALWRLIAAALLVNFSFIIAAAIIDFADIFTKQFLQPLGGGDGLVASVMSSARILDAVVPSPFSVAFNMLKSITWDLIPFIGGKPSGLWVIFNSITGAIFMLILMFVFFAALIFLIIRVVYLWILLIVAPLAWMAWIFPASRRLWTQWWSNFLRWTFFAPVFTFFMFLALRIVLDTSPNSVIFNLQPLSKRISNLNAAATPDVFMMFVLTCGLLIAGLMSANWFSITGAGMVMGMGKWMRGAGLGLTSRWAAKGMKLPAPLQQRFEKLWQRPFLGQPGESIWKRAGTAVLKTITAPTRGLQAAGVAGLLTPETYKRGYAAIKARSEAVAYNETSGRLQDLYYFVASRGKRRTAYAERGRQQTEQALGEEINKTTSTEEEKSAAINQIYGGKNEVERAQIIALLKSDATLNGINTAIANLPDEFKNAVQADVVANLERERDGLRRTGLPEDLVLSNEIQGQVDAMRSQGTIDQGLFLRAWLQRSLGDENRVGRVVNDIGVIARGAGNQSFSGLSRFDATTGQFRSSTYEELQAGAAAQFKKGQAQLTMRNFHPDIFMRDAQGKLTNTLSAAGRKVLAGFQPNHIREGLEQRQMRPETFEHLRKIAALDPNILVNQFTDPTERAAVQTIITHPNVRP